MPGCDLRIWSKSRNQSRMDIGETPPEDHRPPLPQNQQDQREPQEPKNHTGGSNPQRKGAYRGRVRTAVMLNPRPISQAILRVTRNKRPKVFRGVRQVSSPTSLACDSIHLPDYRSIEHFSLEKIDQQYLHRGRACLSDRINFFGR